MVNTWPIIMKGGSTGCIPIQVKIRTDVTKIQNVSLVKGMNARDDIFNFWVKGKINKIIIDMIKAITPPNLLGIDRRIAQANKKYHSGWI